MNTDDTRKTKAQLIAELIELRRQSVSAAAEIQRLRNSEERYHQLIELSPDAIIVHNGREVLFANPTAAQLIGAATPREMIGYPISKLVAPSDYAIVVERMRQVLAGVPVPLEENWWANGRSLTPGHLIRWSIKANRPRRSSHVTSLRASELSKRCASKTNIWRPCTTPCWVCWRGMMWPASWRTSPNTLASWWTPSMCSLRWSRRTIRIWNPRSPEGRCARRPTCN
jgi:PAS domain S-box-containing protein